MAGEIYDGENLIMRTQHTIVNLSKGQNWKSIKYGACPLTPSSAQSGLRGFLWPHLVY